MAAVLTGQLAGADTLAATNDAAAQAAQASAPPRGPGSGSLAFEWWNDPGVQRDLALSADKIKRINDLYGRRGQELRLIIHEYQKQAAELEKMTRERVVDESTFQLQVWKVEAARSRINETRLVMLYRFSRELTPEQNQKLQDILDRRYNRGGRGGSSPATR